MAQSGYTPVSLYYSTTASNQPNASNLQLGELAINITDGKLYYRTVGGVVTLLASATTAAGTASNLSGGTVGALVYQSGVGATAFLSVGANTYILTSNGTTPVYTNPASVSVGSATAATTSTNITGGVANQLVYQTATNATGFVTTPTTGYVLSWSGSAYNWVAGVPASSSANLSGGSAGTIVYQSAVGVSAYVTAGTSSQVLLSGGTGTPTWANQSALTVGSATTATNVAGGVAGAVHYQTGIGATGFSAAGTSGQVLVSGGTGSPTWVNQSTIVTGSTTNLAGGIASQIPYQSGVGATSFIANGSLGQALVSAGTSAPAWGTLGISGGGTGITSFGTGVATALGQNVSGSGSIVLSTGPTILTGVFTAAKETAIAISASDINMALGNYFTKTISATTTFTVSNTASSGTVNSFILDLTNGGSATVNWWSGVKWAGGTAPTLTSSGRDVLGFFTEDGGTTWNGFVLGKAMA